MQEIFDFVLTGTYVSKEIVNLHDSFISEIQAQIEKRNSHLLNLEKIARNSVVSGEIEGITVERDNSFYCIKYPENNVVSPAKFMNNPEFKVLQYDAIRLGKGINILRLYDGRYHDMKGSVKMTVNIGGDVLEMTLSSIKANSLERNALHFGKIAVYMDDKNCEIFLNIMKA